MIAVCDETEAGGSTGCALVTTRGGSDDEIMAFRGKRTRGGELVLNGY